MDLASLEAMCEVVVKGGSPDAFAAANKHVIALQSDVANIPTLQAIFSSSTSSSAILVAARCLQTLVTEHWTSFTEAQRVEIRDYLLNFLAQKGPLLETFAMMAVVSLIVQITKLGWLDAGDGIRSIVDEAKKFLQATVQHCAIGLRLLNDLVTQMNYKSKNRSMTLHRKVAVAFKDAALFQIFEISLTMLNQVATRSIALESLPPDAAARVEDKITEESLSLLVACMSFDFLGSNPDEDAADTTSVQVPASWRERLQSGSTLRVLFNLYKGCTTGRIPLIPDAPAPAIAGGAGGGLGASAGSRGAFGSPAGTSGGFGAAAGGASSAGGASGSSAGGSGGGLFGYKPFSGIAESGAAGAAPTRDMRMSPARAGQCLDALNLMVAVRRSLFASDGDRRRFLSYVLRGVCDILREEAGFANENCFHNFAKLLSKIKTSFQLAELVAAEGYAEWIALTAAFTIKCCGQPVWAGNSMHYILGLWTRLVSSVPYMQAEFASRSGMGMGGSASAMMGLGGGSGMLAARVAAGLSASAAAALAAGGSGAGGAGGHPEVVFDAHIPRIVQAYVRGRLDALAASAAAAAGGGAAAAAAAESNREEVLAQLDDLEVIEDELEQLPAIARYTYEASHAAVTGLMDPLLTRYSEGLSFLAAAPAGTDLSAAIAALRMLECQLAWLVAVAGSIIGGAGSGSGGYASITGSAYYGTAFSGGSAGAAADSRMGGSGAGGSGGSPLAEEHLDGELARRVMQLMTLTDSRISRAAAGAAASGGALPPSTMAALRVDSRLELAFVHFLASFRRAYVNEQGGLPSLALGTATAAAAAAKVVGGPLGGAGGASAGGGGLLSDVASSAAGGGTGAVGGAGAAAMAGARSAAEARALAAEAVRAEAPTLQELYAAATGRQRVFLGLVIRMGLGDHTVVVSLMITKLANNLRFWPERSDIIDRTLDVLNELIFSYSSGRLLLSLDVIAGLLANHSEASFPFLAAPGMVRQRTLFHAALARLVFMEDESEKFEPFMAPLLLTMERLAPAVAAGVRTEEVMRGIIGVCRDLRGVLQAAHNRPTYSLVFDAIFPRHIGTLVASLNTWWDTPAVTTSVLKCLSELAFNRGQRIAFGASSANGILLFREASAAISAYGRRIAGVTPPAHDAYPAKYKGISAALTLFSRALDGNYVNFGVFALYGDTALSTAFETVLKLMLSLSQEDVMSHPKFAMTWLTFLSNAFRSHVEVLLALDSASFLRLIGTLTQALDATDAEVSSQAAYALDFFASYFVRNARKDSPSMTAMRGHLAAQPMLFEALMKLVFQSVVFGEIGNAWSLPRPLLSLILAAEAVRPGCFEAFKGEVVAMQPAENQGRMHDEFVKLMKDITRTLDAVNRDRFQNRITIFRVNLKEFAKVP